MEKQINDRVSSVIEDFLWETNSQDTRNEIARRLSEALEIEFMDRTTSEELDSQFLTFHGYNPKTQKVTVITISPCVE